MRFWERLTGLLYTTVIPNALLKNASELLDTIKTY